MENITLDTKIKQIEGIKNLYQKKYIGLNIYRFIQNEKISTLGDLLMYADYMLVSGDLARKLLKDFIHSLGFVFIDEAGYIEQLRGHIAKKYNIYNFNYQTLDIPTRRKLLDFKLSELLVFYPKEISERASLEAISSSKTLKEVLDEKNYFTKKSKYSPNFSSSNFNFFWDKFIHELGFVFADEDGFEEKMAKLKESEPIAHDWNFALLKTPLKDLNYQRFLSTYTYNYFQNYDIKTIQDVLTKDLTKVPKICLIQLKSLFKFYNLPFIDDEDYLQFKQNALRYLEVIQASEEVFKSIILRQRFKELSQKLLDLINQKDHLKIDNANLERLNTSLESLISTLEEKNSFLERKN